MGPFGLPRRQPAASEPWLSYPACFSASARCSHLRTSAPGSCVRAGTLPCLGLPARRRNLPLSILPSLCLRRLPLPCRCCGWVPGCFPPLSRQGLHWRRHWLGRVAPPECRRRWGGVEPLAPGGPTLRLFFFTLHWGLLGLLALGGQVLLLHFRHCARGGWALLLAWLPALAEKGCGWDLSFLA